MVQESLSKTQAFMDLCIKYVGLLMSPKGCYKMKNGCLYIDKREFLPRDNVKYSYN